MAAERALAPGEEAVVTTIRVSGIPADVSEADFNCWFLFAPDFEQATLAPNKGPGVPQAGWARFASAQAAEDAVYHLNGRHLTADQCPAGGGALVAEMAKRNFRPRYQQGPLAKPMVQPQLLAPAAEDAAAFEAPGGDSTWQKAPPVAGAPATLFVWRLLSPSAEEEIQQLCAEQCLGYERMKFVPPSPGKAGMCFLKFTTHAYAEAALELLGSYALSSSPDEAMHVDFAKSELDEPKGRWQDAGADAAAGSAAAAPQAPAAAAWPPPAARVAPPAVAPGAWAAPGRGRGAQPCDTMFVGNLAASVTEEELIDALSTLAGYERVKLVGEGSERAMAFALFDSVVSCEEAIQALNGNALPSAPSQALTCEFSKNSLNKAPAAAARPPPVARVVPPTVAPAMAKAAPPAAVPGARAAPGRGPCDTMFVGNLAASVTEEELVDALSTLAGFERVKLVGEGGERAMAFALFDSAASCGEAIRTLSGNALPSAPSQALICDFSKNSLNKAVRTT